MNKALFILALLIIIGGGIYSYFFYDKNAVNPPVTTQPPELQETVITEGYKRYVASCIEGGEAEYTCRCQAGLLANVLPEEKLIILTEAGEAIARNDEAKINEIRQLYPEIFVALEDLSDEAAKCVLE